MDRSIISAPFTAVLMGGDGSGGNCPVTTGPFAGSTNWRINVSSTTSASLRRAMGGKTLPSGSQVDTARLLDVRRRTVEHLHQQRHG